MSQTPPPPSSGGADASQTDNTPPSSETQPSENVQPASGRPGLRSSNGTQPAHGSQPAQANGSQPAASQTAQKSQPKEWSLKDATMRVIGHGKKKPSDQFMVIHLEFTFKIEPEKKIKIGKNLN